MGLIPARGTKISQDTEQLSSSTTAREFRGCIQRFCMTQQRPQMLQLRSDRAESANIFFKKKLKLLKKRPCFRQHKNYSAPVTSSKWKKHELRHHMDESRPGAEVCPRQTIGECLYHTPQDKYGIPKRGWEEGSQASALESPLLPVWLRSPGYPTFGRKTTLKGALESGTRPVAAPRCGFTHQSSTSS